MRKVAVVMGSDSDLGVMRACADTLKDVWASPSACACSPRTARPRPRAPSPRPRARTGFGAIIAAAGKAAHLAGAMAANTTLPVIGVPIKSSTLDGLDALLSTVQMPPGMPVATVAIDGAKNAALLAAQITRRGGQRSLRSACMADRDATKGKDHRTRTRTSAPNSAQQ